MTDQDLTSATQRGKWAFSDYGNAYFSTERSRLDAGLRQVIGPSTLQVGSMLDESVLIDLDLPHLLKVQMSHSPSPHSTLPADLAADPAFLPFGPDSFSTVVLPHVLEAHLLPHQVLREAHRVLQHEGCIVITGFNPSSFVGAQRFLRPKSAMPGRYYTAGRVIDWLHVLGFEVVASSIFQYSPLSRSAKVRKVLNFLESVGDRWLPMLGGGYMIAAKKKEPAVTLGGLVKFKRSKRKLAATASVRSHSESRRQTNNK